MLPIQAMRTLGAIAVLLLTLACGERSEQASENAEQQTLEPNGMTDQLLSGGEVIGLIPGLGVGEEIADPELLAADLRKLGVDESQVVLLLDGFATQADQTVAVQRSIDCIEAFGIEVIPRMRMEGGLEMASFDHSSEAPGLTEVEVLEIAEDCQSRFSMAVSQVYYMQEGAAQAVDRELSAGLVDLAACLAENGVIDPTARDMSPGALRQDLGELLNAANQLLETDGIECRLVED